MAEPKVIGLSDSERRVAAGLIARREQARIMFEERDIAWGIFLAGLREEHEVPEGHSCSVDYSTGKMTVTEPAPAPLSLVQP